MRKAKKAVHYVHCPACGNTMAICQYSLCPSNQKPEDLGVVLHELAKDPKFVMPSDISWLTTKKKK